MSEFDKEETKETLQNGLIAFLKTQTETKTKNGRTRITEDRDC